MLTPIDKPKTPKLPHNRGYAVPIQRLMKHYVKVADVKIKARKAKTAGKRTKLGITRFLFELFHNNEILPRSERLTNEKIVMMLLEEFPEQESLHRGLQMGGKAGVNDYRRRYNSGTLIYDVFPERCSFRYNAEGFAVDTRTGRRVLSSQEQREIAERYRQQFLRTKRPRRQLPEVQAS